MKCIFCKTGETEPGFDTFAFQREQCTVVIKNVPADVCDICGEAYFSEQTVEQIEKLVEETVKPHTEIEVLQFAA